jgi:hypothetical protein
MKRPFYFLLVVGLVSGLAGWGLAWKQASDRQRTAATATLGEQAKARKIAEYIAALVGSADEAVLSFRDARDARDVRINDPAWIPRLANAIGQNVCTPTPSGLWISDPEVKLFRNGEPVIELMTLGHILRVLGRGNSGDFIIGQETAAGLSALVHENRLVRPSDRRAYLPGTGNFTPDVASAGAGAGGKLARSISTRCSHGLAGSICVTWSEYFLTSSGLPAELARLASW